jgi:hypothetical protein
MRASCLAIPGLEQLQDWEAHRRQCIRDLAPTNYLEMVLADRVASLLWRLRRVVRYESEVIAIAVKKTEETREEADDFMGSVTVEGLDDMRLTLDEAVDHEKRLSRIFDLEPPTGLSAQDAVFALGAVAAGLNVDWNDAELPLNIPGLPDNTDCEDFVGWSREMVEAGVAAIKSLSNHEDVLLDPWQPSLVAARLAVKEANEEYEGRILQVERDRREALLAPRETVEKVVRYETALERSLFRTLHELQKLQTSPIDRGVSRT